MWPTLESTCAEVLFICYHYSTLIFTKCSRHNFYIQLDTLKYVKKLQFVKKNWGENLTHDFSDWKIELWCYLRTKSIDERLLLMLVSKSQLKSRRRIQICKLISKKCHVVLVYTTRAMPFAFVNSLSRNNTRSYCWKTLCEVAVQIYLKIFEKEWSLSFSE